MREHLPDLNHLADREKDALIVELWEEIQRLRAVVVNIVVAFLFIWSVNAQPVSRSPRWRG